MLISTDTGAAEIVSASEDTRFYDDVGCLASDWAEKRNEGTPYVRVSKGEWKDARQAVYAKHAESRTAMGSGLVAFDNDEEARLVGPDSTILTWEEVVSQRVKP
jgi:nitrous oxide reductase accessory protein NosL